MFPGLDRIEPGLSATALESTALGPGGSGRYIHNFSGNWVLAVELNRMWFTIATILNLVLMLMCVLYRAFWKEAGRRWRKESKQLKAQLAAYKESINDLGKLIKTKDWAFEKLAKQLTTKEAEFAALKKEICLLRQAANEDKEILRKYDRLKKFKEFIIDIFRQHKENKWNWPDEDVLGMVRRCVMSDEEYEALTESEEPK